MDLSTQDGRAAQTARLNTLARRDPVAAGAEWRVTSGVHDLLSDDEGRLIAARAAILARAIAEFDDFPPGNDPYGERDFGAFTLWDHPMFWKIDYFHPTREEHAPCAWSVELCRRTLTVMLASEY